MTEKIAQIVLRGKSPGKRWGKWPRVRMEGNRKALAGSLPCCQGSLFRRPGGRTVIADTPPQIQTHLPHTNLQLALDVPLRVIFNCRSMNLLLSIWGSGYGGTPTAELVYHLPKTYADGVESLPTNTCLFKRWTQKDNFFSATASRYLSCSPGNLHGYDQTRFKSGEECSEEQFI